MVGYILSGILLLILAAVLVRRYLDMKRLDRLSEKMEDYLTGNGGDLSLSLKEDKIAQVENAALELQNRIETAEDRFRQEARRTSNLTADISHQLKTPLASLRLYCESQGCSMDYVHGWMSIVAAAELARGRVQEHDFLLSMVDVVDYV